MSSIYIDRAMQYMECILSLLFYPNVPSNSRWLDLKPTLDFGYKSTESTGQVDVEQQLGWHSTD